MNRKIIIAVLVCVAACTKKAPVSSEKMVELMSDVMLLEAGQAVKFNYGNLPDSLWNREYKFVCDKHQISVQKFKQAMEYYQARPDEFSRIMEKVITRLQKQQVKRQGEQQ